MSGRQISPTSLAVTVSHTPLMPSDYQPCQVSSVSRARSPPVHPARVVLPPGIISLSSAKGVSEELLMALGEAAAATAGDVTGFDPQLLLWSNLDSIADCVDAVLGPEADRTAETAVSSQPAGQQQQQPGGGGDMEEDTAAASRSGDDRGDIQQYLLQHLTTTMAVSSTEEVRWESSAGHVAAATLTASGTKRHNGAEDCELMAERSCTVVAHGRSASSVVLSAA